MTTLAITHPACLRHDSGPGHPESPERLEAVLEALRTPRFQALDWRQAPRAETAQLERVHDAGYVSLILDSVPESGYAAVDHETFISPGSGEALLRAAGAVTAAVDALAAGEARNAFCAVRPPGHHAEPGRGMGFCVFNNVAVGAAHARAVHDYARVAVVDFDVHHGNGTQAMFEGRAGYLYTSTHEWPTYPGTGGPDEAAAENVVNVPLAPMSGSTEFRDAMSGEILPALADFRPDLVLVSAGFDAHADEPLASLQLKEDDYAWLTREITRIAAEHAGGRVVSVLEGGYNLRALADSAAAHVAALMEA